jgi:nitroreductase/molybdopterin/thiamine biosynthesis adenylyltransferase
MRGLRIPKVYPPWREVMTDADLKAWYPLAFDRQNAAHAEAMDEMMSLGEVVHVHDTIDAQLTDLVRTRNPAANLDEQQQQEQVAQLLAGLSPHEYGRWVLFPWSRRLVHLLPPIEFAELRSDRNRNKITKAEQAKLGRLKLALAGLSVGNAIATNLALEGVFGELRLADFDALDLSNMNRIRCAVHEIGVNKAIIAARQIFEQNPYANLVLYIDGVTAENLGEFIDGAEGSGRADMVIDECDSMYIKIKLREEAKARRIPVIMETSDRGMLDIERFDLEPDRPILHGMLGAMTADDIAKLPPQARLGIILQIIGVDTMSARIAASMVEFGRTLRGLSQLGSDVTLGGATTTVAIRRFGIGMPLNSGRIFVDVSSMLAEIRSPELRSVDEAEFQYRRRTAEVRKYVEAAVQAPSDGNRQPWRFVYRHREQTLGVLHDPSRTGGPNDEFGRQMALIAIGAAIENVVIAAGSRGEAVAVDILPAAQDPMLVADLRFSPRKGGASDDPLVEQISQRATNRLPGTRTNLSPVHGQVLASAARDSGAKLQMCTQRDTLDELGKILGEAERIRLLSPALHAELMQTLHWTPTEAEQARDGMALETYAANPAEAATLRLIRTPQVVKHIRDVKGGSGLAVGLSQLLSTSAAVGLLTITGSDKGTFVRGGRAMQQVWLTATALGLAAHPINHLIAMLARVERYHGAGLDKHEIRAIVDLRERFTQCFTVSMNDAEIVLLRFSYSDPTTQRSLRRSVDDVFSAIHTPAN